MYFCFTKIGRDLDQVLADVEPRLLLRLLGARLERLHVVEELLLEAEQEEPRARAHHRVRRHQLRMREALVDVLVDDVRLVEHEVALDQHRGAVVRVHHREVLGLVHEVHVDDLEVHALFVEHDPAAVAEGIGDPRVKRHHSADVLPVFVLEHQREHEEAREEEQHQDPPLLAVGLRRLGHVGEVVHEVGDLLVVVERA